MGKWQGKCVAAFEGTNRISAIMQDLVFMETDFLCKGCEAHSGFFNEWQSLEPCIKQSLTSIGCDETAPLHATGHSMGAAVAALGMLTLKSRGWNVVEVYNFGMPRVANSVLANKFDAMFKGRFFRVTHGADPVVDLPPRSGADPVADYVHVEPEVFYKGSVAQGYVICEKPDDRRCSAQHFKNTSSVILQLATDVMDGNFSDFMGEVAYHKSYMGIGMSCLADESAEEQSVGPFWMSLFLVLWCLGGFAWRVSFAMRKMLRRISWSKIPDDSCQHLVVEGEASPSLQEPLLDNAGPNMI